MYVGTIYLYIYGKVNMAKSYGMANSYGKAGKAAKRCNKEIWQSQTQPMICAWSIKLWRRFYSEKIP